LVANQRVRVDSTVDRAPESLAATNARKQNKQSQLLRHSLQAAGQRQRSPMVAQYQRCSKLQSQGRGAGEGPSGRAGQVQGGGGWLSVVMAAIWGRWGLGRGREGQCVLGQRLVLDQCTTDPGQEGKTDTARSPVLCAVAVPIKFKSTTHNPQPTSSTSAYPVSCPLCHHRTPRAAFC
jgi:hypothetical protein